MNYTSSSPQAPPPPPTVPSATPLSKALEDVSEKELEQWLTSINLSSLVPRLREHDVSGEMLAMCRTPEEIAEFGCKTAQSRLLFSKIQAVQADGGIPLSLLSAAPPLPVSSPVLPAAPMPSAPPETGKRDASHCVNSITAARR